MSIISFHLVFEESSLSNPQSKLDFKNLTSSLFSLVGVSPDRSLFYSTNTIGENIAFDEQFTKEFHFYASADRIEAVIGTLFDWLTRISPKTIINVEISSKTVVNIDVYSPKDIIYLGGLINSFLPVEFIYLEKVKAYISNYGELTPASNSSLNFLRDHFKIPSEAAEEINQSALGVFKNLDEKYKYFRRELLKYKNEIALADIDQSIPAIFQEKASHLNLPEDDAFFLWKEFCEIMEEEGSKKDLENAENEQSKKQQELARQHQLLAYKEAFRSIFKEQLHGLFEGRNRRNPELISFESQSPGTFQEFDYKSLDDLSCLEFRKGQLDEIRNYFDIASQDKKIVETELFGEIMKSNESN